MMTLNHGFSGYVCGRVAMPVLKRYSPLSQAAMGWAFFLGAMMPDGDVITRVFGGHRDYFGGSWFSHRQFSHSLLGTLIEALVIGAVLFFPAWRQAESSRRAYAWVVGCLWVGGWLHIIGDMMTPSRPLPVFWPLPYAFGGWSHIGWFSPYLLLMFVTTLLIDGVLRGIGRTGLFGTEREPRWLTAAMWVLYAAAAFRWIEYMIASRYESAAQWEAYQHALLPEPLVALVTSGVAVLWSLIAK